MRRTEDEIDEMKEEILKEEIEDGDHHRKKSDEETDLEKKRLAEMKTELKVDYKRADEFETSQIQVNYLLECCPCLHMHYVCCFTEENCLADIPRKGATAVWR